MSSDSKAALPNCVRFVVIGGGRTGSTMLVRALNSSPRIRCFGEVFNGELDFIPFGVDGYDDFSRDDRAARARDYLDFLEKRIYGAAGPDVRAVGFKLLYGQERHFSGFLDRLVEDEALHMVHLRRRNLLRTVVSLKIAETTGAWVDSGTSTLGRSNALQAVRHPLRAAAALQRRLTARPKPGDAATSSVTIGRDECESLFSFVQTQEVFYENAFLDHHRWTLYYEDIIERPDREYRQVLEFLGLEPEQLSVTTRKQNPEPLRDLISNYDELRDAFSGTPHAAYFE